MPDYRSAALITIDVQVDTLDGQPAEIAGTSAAMPRIAALAAGFRDAKLPIVHIVRVYRSDGSNVDICRRAAFEAGLETFFAAGSSGSQLAPEMLGDAAGFELDASALLAGRSQEVRLGEIAMYKPRWGAFYETALEAHLRGHGVSTLVFCGCNFPNCPRTSIYEASERDFRVVLADDAVSGLYERGSEELRRIGVGLAPTAEIVRSLIPAAAGAP